jgi:hypothetical protein
VQNMETQRGLEWNFMIAYSRLIKCPSCTATCLMWAFPWLKSYVQFPSSKIWLALVMICLWGEVLLACVPLVFGWHSDDILLWERWWMLPNCLGNPDDGLVWRLKSPVMKGIPRRNRWSETNCQLSVWYRRLLNTPAWSWYCDNLEFFKKRWGWIKCLSGIDQCWSELPFQENLWLRLWY